MNSQQHKNHFRTAFIIGAPRSGTTILGKMLDIHPDIRQWVEPYFVWDRYFRGAPDDHRTAQDGTPDVCNRIYNDFFTYWKKQKESIIIDKSPRNSLKIGLILKIFPQARFIHILRDGRDVILSIFKRWKRLEIEFGGKGQSAFDPVLVFRRMVEHLTNQSGTLNKARSLWHETRGHFDKNKHLNRLRWDGHAGFGPRFKDWREIFYNTSLLEFNAHQWLKCVQEIQENRVHIPSGQFMEIRYEDLITSPVEVVGGILDYLEIGQSNGYYERLPEMNANNSGKWKHDFTGEQLNRILPVIGEKLVELGYEPGQEKT